MLKIAVVGNTYKDTINYIKYKFQDRIEIFNSVTGVHTLKNGDEIHLCYGEENKDRYKSMIFDAFIVIPQYQTLLDVIRFRTERHI